MLKGGEVQYIKVGIFVSIALAVAMFMVFMIGSDKRVFESQYRLNCIFEDISGLRIGAPVQLAGVNVGFVDNINFPRDLMKKEINVTISIAKKYQLRIREDSLATINTQGLLGDKYIFISIGSEDQPELKDGDTIKTKEVVGLFALAEKGGEILDDLAGAAKDISKFFADLDEDQGGIKEILNSVRDIVGEVEKGKGLVHALVYDPKGEEIMASIASSVESLKILLGDTEKDDERKKRIRGVAANLNAAAKNIKEITDKINRGEGTLGGLVVDPSIYNDIRSIFGKANRNSLFKTVVRATLEENEREVLKW